MKKVMIACGLTILSFVSLVLAIKSVSWIAPSLLHSITILSALAVLVVGIQGKIYAVGNNVSGEIKVFMRNARMLLTASAGSSLIALAIYGFDNDVHRAFDGVLFATLFLAVTSCVIGLVAFIGAALTVKEDRVVVRVW